MSLVVWASPLASSRSGWSSRVRPIGDCGGLDREELLVEVKERRALIDQMVGRLYPEIVAAEIAKLEELVWALGLGSLDQPRPTA